MSLYVVDCLIGWVSISAPSYFMWLRSKIIMALTKAF